MTDALVHAGKRVNVIEPQKHFQYMPIWGRNKKLDVFVSLN